jgi:RNA polymerase sigma-70 factor, ECF subfamily
MAVAADKPTDEWLQECGPALLLYARQWVRDATDAEDVLQTAFVRYWSTRGNVADPVSYLYSCVRTTAMNFNRGNSRRREREEISGMARSNLLKPVDDLERSERKQMIELALQSLPVDQREVIVLKVWGQLTFSQIAEAMNASPSTTASRYRYAMDALRMLLSQKVI